MRKPLFEEFWRSGAPLIGEEGSSGWSVWKSQHPAVVPQTELLPVQGACDYKYSSQPNCTEFQSCREKMVMSTQSMSAECY